jgi:hypothetical protein
MFNRFHKIFCNITDPKVKSTVLVLKTFPFLIMNLPHDDGIKVKHVVTQFTFYTKDYVCVQ